MIGEQTGNIKYVDLNAFGYRWKFSVLQKASVRLPENLPQSGKWVACHKMSDTTGD
jgi:hypothetical protein